MRDGVYTSAGRTDLPDTQPRRKRRRFPLLGFLVMGAAMLGMVLSGILRKKRKQREDT